MESIPKDEIFEFNPDTLQYLREQYHLNIPGRIEEAITALEEWLKKQDHFVRKEFPKDYLERTIIICKGSVERAKTKLDKICTYRTLYPEYFGKYNLKNCKLMETFYGEFLPKLTSDHYRVYVLKNGINKPLDTGFIDFYRYFYMQCEYIQAHDYCNGVIIFIDYTEANIIETIKWFNISDLKHAFEILKQGYGMRIKGIHFYTESKVIDAIVSIFKQAVSPKIATRIHVHKTLDKAYKYLPQEILPAEYGGKEKSLLEIQKKNANVLTSTEFSNYLEEMSKACTIEHLRQAEAVNGSHYMGISEKNANVLTSTEFSNYLEEMSKACTIEHLRQAEAVNGSHYMGISGTFRNLSVD